MGGGFGEDITWFVEQSVGGRSWFFFFFFSFGFHLFCSGIIFVCVLVASTPNTPYGVRRLSQPPWRPKP